MKTVVKTLFIILLVVGPILVVCCIDDILEAYSDSKLWDDGICSNCGGCLEFTRRFELTNDSTAKTASSRHTYYYFYTCKRCGHMITLNSRYK